MPKIERICKICGKVFFVWPVFLRKNKTGNNAIYCSRSCMFKDEDYMKRRTRTLRKHYENPEMGKTRSEKLKAHYENPEARKKNSEALLKAYSNSDIKFRPYESRIGGFWYGNVKYYDYIQPQYCEKWTNDLKERVRAYFNYTCLECGAKQNGKKLDVHHVYYNKKACCDNTPRVLVPLCHACHSKTTSGDRAYWTSHFQEIIDLMYGGRCWMSKEEYASLLAKPLSSHTPTINHG